MKKKKKPNKKRVYHVLGLMSGSSLDGIDLALCRFEIAGKKVKKWKMKRGATIPYTDEWVRRLRDLPSGSAKDLAAADGQLGKYFGEAINTFLGSRTRKPHLIASHGHTVFHDPSAGFTCQIGDGAVIAAVTGVQTADNFRAQDIGHNGQGAPLAPIIEQNLPGKYDFYLNLGGIANLSAHTKDGMVAFDVGGANQVLNELAKERGLPFDSKGLLAATGKVLPELLRKAASLPFHQKPFPKSLGNAWVREQLIPLFKDYEGTLEDRMHTAVVYIVGEVSRAITVLGEKYPIPESSQKMLVTGGGAHNEFLITMLSGALDELNIQVVLPEEEMIDYKEAVLMALMGALRLAGLPNVLSNVTGADKSSVGGALHYA